MEIKHTFKVPDIFCRVTGTDDYAPNANQECCKACTYKQMCNAKYDEQQLIEAKELIEESRRLADEAKQLEDKAKEVFSKIAKDNGLIKYQFDQYMISSVYVKESITYPKAKLLKVFTIDQLAPAGEKKEAYTYLRIDDLLKRDHKND